MTVYNTSASNALQLTQVASKNIIALESVSHTIGLISEVELNHKIKLTSSTLALNQILSTDNVLFLAASSDLNLTQSTIRKGTLSVEATNQLNLTQIARSLIHARSASNTLNLQSVIELSGRPIYISASNDLAGELENVNFDDLFDIDINDPEAIEEYLKTIGLRQSVSTAKSKHNVSAINYLSLSQEAGRGIYVSAANHLHLSHQLEQVLYEIVTSYIHFQQDAVCYKVYGVEQVLELTHTIDIDGIFPESVTSSLNLKSVVSYINVNFCDYSPGIGDGSYDYTPPSSIAPTLTRRSTTVLTWPYSSPILTVELRNPNFDNVEQFEARRINRRTKGGSLDFYRDESWPKIERLIYSFSVLSEIQRSNLFEFLERSIGQEIGILDFESRQWKGILLTPSSAISEPRKDGYDVSLEFEGELVP